MSLQIQTFSIWQLKINLLDAMTIKQGSILDDENN